MHTMSAILLLPPMAGIMALIVLKNINPAWSVEAQLPKLDSRLILAGSLAVLAVVNAGLLFWARRIFQRSRLIAG